jgi:fructokinase
LLNFGQQRRKLSQKGKVIQMPAIKIDKVMDSTGAGDAFGLDFYLLYQKKLLMNV